MSFSVFWNAFAMITPVEMHEGHSYNQARLLTSSSQQIFGGTDWTI
jgi:hypothetical protein